MFNYIAATIQFKQIKPYAFAELKISLWPNCTKDVKKPSTASSEMIADTAFSSSPT